MWLNQTQNRSGYVSFFRYAISKPKVSAGGPINYLQVTPCWWKLVEGKTAPANFMTAPSRQDGVVWLNRLQRLATFSNEDHMIRLWDLNTGKVTRSIQVAGERDREKNGRVASKDEELHMI
jgi:hypothetical protein